MVDFVGTEEVVQVDHQRLCREYFGRVMKIADILAWASNITCTREGPELDAQSTHDGSNSRKRHCNDG